MYSQCFCTGEDNQGKILFYFLNNGDFEVFTDNPPICIEIEELSNSIEVNLPGYSDPLFFDPGSEVDNVEIIPPSEGSLPNFPDDWEEWSKTGNVGIGYSAFSNGTFISFNAGDTVAVGTASRSFFTIPGGTYTFSFSYTYRGRNKNQKLNWQIGDKSGQEIVGVGSVSDSFIATSSEATILFSDVNSNNTVTSDMLISSVTVIGTTTSGWTVRAFLNGEVVWEQEFNQEPESVRINNEDGYRIRVYEQPTNTTLFEQVFGELPNIDSRCNNDCCPECFCEISDNLEKSIRGIKTKLEVIKTKLEVLKLDIKRSK